MMGAFTPPWLSQLPPGGPDAGKVSDLRLAQDVAFNNNNLPLGGQTGLFTPYRQSNFELFSIFSQGPTRAPAADRTGGRGR